MHAVLREDERLVRFTKICLGLPRAEREIMGSHAGFKVKKKTFAYFLNDHHGDGIVGVLCKVLAGDNAALIKADPKRFYMPAYVGPRGWVGLRLDVGRVNWGEVEELAKGSYQLVAGKTLAGAGLAPGYQGIDDERGDFNAWVLAKSHRPLD